MAQTTQQTVAQQIPQEFPVQVVALPLGEQNGDSKQGARSEKDELVLEIMESTLCIRRRTDNREIHAILDEILWLARSI